jgi:hypothetical protein
MIIVRSCSQFKLGRMDAVERAMAARSTTSMRPYCMQVMFIPCTYFVLASLIH